MGRVFAFGLALLAFLALAAVAFGQNNTLATVAGGGTNVGPATSAYLPSPFAVVRDTLGNTYVSVPTLFKVYKIDTSGHLTIYAGSNSPYPNFADTSYLGDGGPATSAQLQDPYGLAIDANNNLFIAEWGSCRIRRVDAQTGIITTVAGSGALFSGGYSGDGGPATSAVLNYPEGIAVDSAGNLFIADTQNNVIRKVDNSAQHIITTYASNPQFGFPTAVVVDNSDNLFVDGGGPVYRVDSGAAHTVTVYAGGGSGGDGGPASSASVVASGLSVDGTGNLFIADNSLGPRVRKVDNTANHIISTVVGTGAQCINPSSHCGDGGPATAASLNSISDVFADSTGGLTIADAGTSTVRRVPSGANPTISTVAGGGSGGDGGAAQSAVITVSVGIASDAAGNIFFTDGTRVRRLDAASHIVTTYAGNGFAAASPVSYGDGQLATSANLFSPESLALDSAGNLYIGDVYFIRRVDAQTKLISTVAGPISGGFYVCESGLPTYPNCGDGGPATAAAFGAGLYGLAVDNTGNLFVADVYNARVRRVDGQTGVITNYAGTPGSSCCTLAGLGGPAGSATIGYPFGLSIDSQNNLYIVDEELSRVYAVDSSPQHILTLAAFNGQPIYSGDGGPAVSASAEYPLAVAADSLGNFYVSGGYNNLLRRVDKATATITSVAGDLQNTLGGYSPDGAPAIGSLIGNLGVALDANQNLYFLDNSYFIRKVHMAPVATLTGSFTSFGPTPPGGTSSAQSIALSNYGMIDLTVSSISISNSYFAVTQGCSSTIPPGGQFGAPHCQVTVEFKPPVNAAPGTVSGTLTIGSTDPVRPSITLPLSGTVMAGAAQLLEVTKSGGGAGTVVSSPAGINCGTSCSASFAFNTTVTLTATQANGSAFNGWSGACSNSSGRCTVLMTQAQSVTAKFAPISSTPSAGPFAYVPRFNAGDLQIYDLSTHLLVHSVTVGGGPFAAAASPDGSHVYVTSFDGGTLSVIDTADYAIAASIPVGSLPGGVAVSPDSTRVYVGGAGSNAVYVINGSTNEVETTIPVASSPGFVAITPDGAKLYVSNGGSNGIAVINTATETVTASIPVGGSPQGLSVTPDGSAVYVACPGSGSVYKISTSTETVSAVITVPGTPYYVSISPDGATGYVSEYYGDATAFVNLTTNAIVATVPVGGTAFSSAISPDGSQVLQSTLTSNAVSVISTSSRTVSQNLPVNSGVYILSVGNAPTQSQSITQPLSPTTPNTFNFGPHRFVVQYPAGSNFSNVDMTVVAAQANQQTFKQRVAGTQFANATCIVYTGSGGNCVDYQVTCSSPSGGTISCPSEPSPTISVKTSFDTQQSIVNPGLLTTPIGENEWANIFESFYLQRIDPTVKGRTKGFSEFVAVDLGASNGQGAGTVNVLAPLASSDTRIFPPGTTIPVQFALTSIAHPGTPVTDATAGISVVQTADANGKALSNIVLDAPTGFKYSGSAYKYSLSTSAYAVGTYVLTIYGNAFAAQQISFTIPTSTTGAQLSVTVPAIVLNSAGTQYVATLSIANTGPGAANGVLVTAAVLNSTTTATALPVGVGDIAPGKSATTTVAFPISAGAQNSRGAITVSLTYAGGTAGGGVRVLLP